MTWLREPEDLRGRQFGHWTVLRRLYPSEETRVYPPGRHPPVRWRCRCSCGRLGTVEAHDLRRGQSTGCQHCRWERKHPELAAKLAGVSA